MSDDIEGSALEAKHWVESNLSTLTRAFNDFMEHGEWPTILELQRALDQADQYSNTVVEAVVMAKPKVLNEPGNFVPERLSLQIRHLMWIREASHLVAWCLTVIQRGVERYFSDDANPAISKADRDLFSPVLRFQKLDDRVHDVLTVERPSPFGGSSKSPDSWSIYVDTRFARRFQGIHTIADFVRRQDEIRAEMAAAIARAPSLVQILNTDTLPALEAPNEPVLFVSWGGDRSKTVARVLDEILTNRLTGVSVLFSPRSISPGDDPTKLLFDEGLLQAAAMAVVLTKDGADRPWVIWETAVMWALERMIIPIFVDVDPKDVPGPLAQKVQGVFLSDRAEIDRAINRLATQYGISDVPELSDDEYGALESASR